MSDPLISPQPLKGVELAIFLAHHVDHNIAIIGQNPRSFAASFNAFGNDMPVAPDLIHDFFGNRANLTRSWGRDHQERLCDPETLRDINQHRILGKLIGSASKRTCDEIVALNVHSYPFVSLSLPLSGPASHRERRRPAGASHFSARHDTDGTY